MNDKDIIKAIREATEKLNGLIYNAPDNYRIDINIIDARKFSDRFSKPVLVIDILEAK